MIKKDLARLVSFGEALAWRPSVRVGIFGNKTGRQNSSVLTNAELGMTHELGSPKHNIPPRSWLMMPITTFKARITKNAAKDFEHLVMTGKTRAFWTYLGHEAEEVIQEAFDTGGWGAWAPLKIKSLLRKLHKAFKSRSVWQWKQVVAEASLEGNKYGDKILVDTAQLRHAVASQVVAR